MSPTTELKRQQQINFIVLSRRKHQSSVPAAASLDYSENYQLQIQNIETSLDYSENKRSRTQKVEQQTDKTQRQHQRRFTEPPNREHQSSISAAASLVNSLSQQLQTQMVKQQAVKNQQHHQSKLITAYRINK